MIEYNKMKNFKKGESYNRIEQNYTIIRLWEEH